MTPDRVDELLAQLDVAGDMDERYDVRIEALDELDELADRRAVPRLVELLVDFYEGQEEARAAARALGAIGDLRAGPALTMAMIHVGDLRWEAAMNALARFDDPCLDAVVDQWQDYRRARLPRSMGAQTAAELRAARAWEERRY